MSRNDVTNYKEKKHLSNWMEKDRILLSRPTIILLHAAQKSTFFTLSASIAWK